MGSVFSYKIEASRRNLIYHGEVELIFTRQLWLLAATPQRIAAVGNVTIT